ncbi:hypothetical protein QR680_007799 [Steinernema hermaphroditum]|uniref:Uncharacterized protein n=1 Tax=Steinernema hermaphroditum TaxID=289476 RepID=A0AA39M6Z0_9BILA|nr:hypothetical protein QR680_007799 [Steinernema hermaphroditum]
MSDDAPMPEKKDNNEETMEVDATTPEPGQEYWWKMLVPPPKPKSPTPSPPPITETFFEDAHVYPRPRDRFEKEFFFGSVKVRNMHERSGTSYARVDILDKITNQFTAFHIDDGIYDVVFCEGRQEFYFSGMKQTIYCYFYVADNTELRDDYLVIRRQYSRGLDGKWTYVPVLLDNTITKGWMNEDDSYVCTDKPRVPRFEKCRNAPVLLAANLDNIVYVINSHLEREGCSVFFNNEHIADLDSKVVLMDAGATHTLFLTENHQLYSMGASLHGQLGHGDLHYEKEPKLVEYFEALKVVDIAAGPFQSIIISDDGEACGFGWNSCSQLGTEFPVGDIVTTPAPMMPEEDKNFYVSSFACDGFTALLSAEGEVVMFPKERPTAECI